MFWLEATVLGGLLLTLASTRGDCEGRLKIWARNRQFSVAFDMKPLTYSSNHYRVLWTSKQASESTCFVWRWTMK